MRFLQPRTGNERSMGWFFIAAGTVTLALLVFSSMRGDVSLASFLATAAVLVAGAGFVLPAAPPVWEKVSQTLRLVAIVLGIAAVVMTLETLT